MDLLNGAVAAFAHRAISERNPEMLAAEALAYLAAGLEAERTELFVASADGRSLELLQRFPASRIAAAETISARGSSMPAEAYARGGVVMHAEGVATAVECDGRVCVFVAWSRKRPFPAAARNGIDAIAAMYAAAVARNAAEAQLADRESRLRLILDQIPAVVTTLDTALMLTSAQGAGLAALPAEAVAEIVGRKIADGDETSLPMIAARKVLAGVATQFDVTEKRQADEALRESREELRRLSAAMRELEENQRRRIAREIRDDLGQRLTALRLDVGLLRTELREGRTAAAEERTAAMLDLVDETLTTARRVAMELRPAILDDFGFAAAVEHEVESFARRSGIEISLSIRPEEISIESARATALYRVIQEALTNVVRHSGASHVDVRVETRQGRIEAEVRDNGRGITNAQSNGAGLGLIGIRERILAFDGNVRIEGLENGGTRVFVSVPDEDPHRG